MSIQEANSISERPVKPVVFTDEGIRLHFRTRAVGQPPLTVWFMVIAKGKGEFPWWNYDPTLDSYIQTLHDLWSVMNPQQLLDCLFLFSLYQSSGPGLFFVFPGSIKMSGWHLLKNQDYALFSSGTPCVYHLQGWYDTQPRIHWVPYFAPQSVLRKPSFGTAWRLFLSGAGEDVANCLSFFSLTDPKQFSDVARLLNQPRAERSMELAELSDWFGMISSPLRNGVHPFSVIYTKQDQANTFFKNLENTFTALVREVKGILLSHPHPKALIQFMSRHILI